MRKTLLILAGSVTLAACAPEVPDSRPGVGFDNYATYEAQREAALNGGQRLPGAGQAVPAGMVPVQANQNGFSTERLASAINAADPQGANMTPAVPMLGQVIGDPLSALGTAPATIAGPAVEVTPQFAAPITAAPNAVAPANLPSTNKDGSANIVQYALSTTNPVGTSAYPRSGLKLANPEAACKKFASSDQAQQAFLSAGGPAEDSKGLDPDGDGFACGWNPAPFRAALN